MPLYECHCAGCDLTFEVLAPLSASGMKSRPCPGCGRPSRRVISAVSFAIGGGARAHPADEPSDPSRPDITKLRVPPYARICGIDDRSAARFAAYKLGRGAEYDDKLAAREDLRKRRGAPPEPSPPAPAHGHDRGRNFRRREAQAAAEAASLGQNEHHNHGRAQGEAAKPDSHGHAAAPKGNLGGSRVHSH